jgi:hypothetical protein
VPFGSVKKNALVRCCCLVYSHCTCQIFGRVAEFPFGLEPTEFAYGNMYWVSAWFVLVYFH